MSRLHSSIENINEQIRKLENKNIDDSIEKEQIETTKVFKIGDDTNSYFDGNTPIIVGGVDDTLLEQRQSEKKEYSMRRSSEIWKLILVLICLFVSGLLIFMFFIK